MRLQVSLFAATVFASAFLIFVVQPMVGKHILPWFGGAPSVWMVCLCFYQLTLFAGYAYAHWLIDRLRPSRQLVVHALLFAVALAALPVLPDASWKPAADASPSARILAMLAVNVAPAFLLLAATGPLLQAWYARAFPARSPYVLYAVSNVGSLLALLSFPIAIEPQLPLSAASRFWSVSFALCGGAILACAWIALRRTAVDQPPEPAGAAQRARATSSRGDVALWILLPACAVVLFMGVTNELCLDVASFPFLWIAPLAIYLLTFIVCFGSRTLYRRSVFAPAAALSLGAVIWIRQSLGSSLSVWSDAPPVALVGSVYSFALFASCMLLHGELHRLRPPAERLTAYYLCISGGGSLGGLFVGIVAPQIFSEYYELPIGWAACWLLFAVACLRSPGALLRRALLRRAFAASVGLAIAGLGAAAAHKGAVGAGELLYQKRNFYGILRVIERRPEQNQRHHVRFKSGSTTHGAQALQAKLRRHPIPYFGPGTGIGLAMGLRSDAPTHVGIVGLGVGALASYGREGDLFRFYEIDPDVLEIARDSGHFTYLRDSAAEIEYVLGDARLSLERELERGGSQRYDLLVLDAFRSDSIPVHLITDEAFSLYVRHLKPGGVIAAHVSSVNFDLKPLVFRLAERHGLEAVAVSSTMQLQFFQFGTEWMIMSADLTNLQRLAALAQSRRKAMRIGPADLYLSRPDPAVVRSTELWTDDHSNPLSALVIRPLADPW